MSSEWWCSSKPALTRLIRLLSCPLCTSLMSDPCVLDNCSHHFCRRCIEWSISEKQASCPICHLPAWAKDVKSDRQIDTVIGCVSSMDRLMVQSNQTCLEPSSVVNEDDGSCGKPVRRKLKSRKSMHQPCLLFPPISHNCQSSSMNSEKTSRHAPSNNKENLMIDAAPALKIVKMRQRNIRGETPLHIAAIKGNFTVMQALLQQGSNPNVRDNAGWTPLHECCNHGHPDVAALLLDHGALINAPGFDGDTPLHDAVANGHFKVASLLISRGANPLLKNCRGIVAGDFATTETMKKLLSVSLITDLNDSSPSHSTGKELVLLGTGLKSHQKIQLEETAKQLGARSVEGFTSQVTHLITNTNQSKCCPRTMKFLCAVAEGKWIVSFQCMEWKFTPVGIIRCHQEKQWVDESPYEVLGTILDDRNFLTHAPQKGRENAVLEVPKLFSGCEFYFAGEYCQPHPPKQDLEHLVKLAGGTVLGVDPRSTGNLSENAIPSYNDSSGSSSVILLVNTSSTDTQNCSTTDFFRVSPSWIFDSLSEFKLLL